VSRKQLTATTIPFLTGLAMTVILLLIFSQSPSKALIDFFGGSFISVYYAGFLVNTSVLLVTAGLGAAAALSVGECNLGGEGQIYAGGFTAAVILANCPDLHALPALLLAGTAAAVSGAFIILISAVLKHLKNASVLLTSFLVSSAVIPFIDSLIAGKFRGSTGNLLATPFIAEKYRFFLIAPPSPLSTTVFAVPLLCAAGWYFLYHTYYGNKIQILGISPEFAHYCGYHENTMIYSSLLASGAFHGITGFIAVCGMYYTCHSGFYSGMGWNGLSCALIAGSNPAFLIPAGLLLSWLYTSASRVAFNQNFNFDITGLIQGIVLFTVSLHYMTRRTANDYS
jgi:riboflavin transport system permease protein